MPSEYCRFVVRSFAEVLATGWTRRRREGDGGGARAGGTGLCWRRLCCEPVTRVSGGPRYLLRPRPELKARMCGWIYLHPAGGRRPVVLVAAALEAYHR